MTDASDDRAAARRAVARRMARAALKAARPARDALRAVGPAVEARSAGNALLVHPRGFVDSRAVAFAEGLAADPQHTLVVLDLPARPKEAVWEAVARTLDREGRSFRLVPGRGTRADVGYAAQWLSDRLNRIVLAPDGTVVPAAAGALFVPADRGQGWLRYRPKLTSAPDSRRFPRPKWEFSVPDSPRPIGPGGIAEPLPGGVWIRGNRDEAASAEHRQSLIDLLVGDPELLAVVLGSPGASSALALEEIAAFWDTIPHSARHLVRFVPYGPVAVPGGEPLGQALADLLGQRVAVYAGIPAPNENGTGREVRTLHDDGSLGWRPYAEEFGFTPRTHTAGRAVPPVPLGTRVPTGDIAEVAPGIYQYAPDVLLEVVRSGLWVRPPTEPLDGHAVRAAPPDPARPAILYDQTDPVRAERMRTVANGLLSGPAPSFLRGGRVLPSSEAGRVPPSSHPSPAVSRMPPAAAHLGPVVATGPVESGQDSGWDADQHPQATARPLLPSLLQGGATWTDQSPAPVVAADLVGNGHGGTDGPAGFPGLPDTGGEPAATGPGVPPVLTEVDGVGGPGGSTAPPIATGAGVPPSMTGSDLRGGPDGPVPRWSEGPPPAAQAAGPGVATGAPAGTARSATVTRPSPSPSPTPSPSPSPTPTPTLAPSPAPPSAPHPEPPPSAPSPVRVLPSGGGAPGGPPPPGAPTPDGALPGPELPEPALPEPELPEPELPGPVLPEPELPAGPLPAGVGTPPTAAAGAPRIRLESPDPAMFSADPAATGDTGATGGPVPAPTAVPDSPAAPDALAPDALAVPNPPGPPGAGGDTVQVQPEPAAGASAVPSGNGVGKERDWLRRSLGGPYDTAAAFVSRVLSESPGLHGGPRSSVGDALTDLAAVRLYLSSGTPAIDAAVRSATAGPHVPLVRCATSGLRRLPSHRGGAVLRATLGPAERAWYREGLLVTERSFLAALSALRADLPGDTDILLWSLTARRTSLVVPEVPDRVLFTPGTRFKVLRTVDGDRPAVMMREVAEAEVDEQGRLREQRVPMDEIALTGLGQLHTLWQRAEDGVEGIAGDSLPDEHTDAFHSAPGLIQQPPGAGGGPPPPPSAGTTTQQGGKP